MTRVLLPLLLAVSVIAAVVAEQQAAQTGQSAGQAGDQLLDGIGETSLIARYQFNGNAEDSSRNQLMPGAWSGAASWDPRQALLGDGSHVQLPSPRSPAKTRSPSSGGCIPDTRRDGLRFRPEPGRDCLPSWTRRASRLGGVDQVRGETPAKPVVENQWTHFAVVLDPASRVLTAYVDGARTGQAANVNVTPAQLVPPPRPTGCPRARRRHAVLHGHARCLYRVALGDAHRHDPP
jgi:hypothetical protein